MTKRSRERGERGFGLGAIVRDDHAFAGGQAVGLEDHREAEAVAARGGLRPGCSTVTNAAVGMFALCKKVLCENFAAFESGGGAVGSDDVPAARAERDRPLRPPGALRARPRSGRRRLLRRSRDRTLASHRPPGRHVRDLRDAGIARRARTPSTPGDLRQSPRQRVLAPAAAEDQDFHSSIQ